FKSPNLNAYSEYVWIRRQHQRRRRLRCTYTSSSLHVLGLIRNRAETNRILMALLIVTPTARPVKTPISRVMIPMARARRTRQTVTVPLAVTPLTPMARTNQALTVPLALTPLTPMARINQALTVPLAVTPLTPMARTNQAL